jgi:copper chaperone NosL
MRLLLSIIFLFSTLLYGAMFQSVPEEKAQLLQQGDAKHYCPQCGMKLSKFYKTSHALSHKGHTAQYCSLHCLVDANPYTDLIKAKVVDLNSLKFINAHDAYYVIGSKKPGTMSMNSKYAFKSKSDAEKFAQQFGGKLHNFHEAVDIAFTDRNKNNQMIHKKRTKVAKKGKKMFEALCKDAKLPEFHSISKAKSYIVSHQSCGKLKDKQAQAIAIYLNQKNAPDHHHAIVVPKDAKCPVCGMFVSKYPKWAAKITTDDAKAHYFDGNKDMFKFYFDAKAYKLPYTKKEIQKMQVTDYYTIRSLDAKKAYYVIGSNVYGPMGNELISFASKDDATTFKKDHFATKVLSFDEITPSIVMQLDQ